MFYTIIDTPCFPCRYKIVRWENGRIVDIRNDTHLYFRTIDKAKAGIVKLGGLLVNS